MKTDIYTKIILSVIALFLALNYFKDTNLITSAQANTAQIPVHNKQSKDTVIIGGIVDVNLMQTNGQNIFLSTVKLKDGTQKALIPVSLEYHDLLSPLDVNLQLIKGDNIYAPEKYSSIGSFQGRMLGVVDPYQ